MATEVKAERRESEKLTPGAMTPMVIDILQNKWVQGVLIVIGLFFVYFAAGNESNPYNQHVQLADSLLHGRLYLENPPAYLELARYFDNGMACNGPEVGCKGYVVEPPAPAVLLIPFVAAFGPDLNQVFVSMAFGAATIGLFWVATRQLGWNPPLRAAMIVLLGLGTNFWWAAGDGSLWTFSQVCAVFFMMAALIEATGHKRPWLVGILLGLAGLSRLPTFLGFPFFLYLVVEHDIRNWRGWRSTVRNRGVIKKVLLFGSGLGAMASLILLYNYGRYHTIFDAGYNHPQYHNVPPFTQGRFSISYIPRHIEAIFYLGPKLNESQFPFFQPSVYGMALVMVTPAFLYIFGARMKPLEVTAAVTMLLVMIPHVLYGATGWAQFGYRFSLDYFPMLAVLTAAGMDHQMGIRKWLVIGLSVFIAMWGPLFFFDTRLEDLLGYQWKL